MGLIVDTSLFIEAERSGLVLVFGTNSVLSRTGETEFAISAVTLSELAFGYAYARLSLRERTILLRQTQRQFRSYSVDDEIAIRAGEVNAELRRNGKSVGFADVLIAATALELGFGVLTHNTRHFSFISGLRVVDAKEL